MTPRPPDTALASWSAYHDVLDRLGGPGRLHAAIDLSDSIREVRLAGIRARHPELTETAVVARLVWEEHGVRLPTPR